MRARGLITAVACAGAVASGAASVGTSVGAAAGKTWSTNAVSWSLLGVGPHGRSLEVGFAYGGCDRNPKASTTEQSRTVTISVTIEVDVTPGVVCPAFERLATAEVAMKAPIAGRRVLGKWEGATDLGPSPRAFPRLIGLAAADARRVVATVGAGRLRVSTQLHHGVQGLARIILQSPAAGAALRRTGTVRLVVGEH